MFVYSCNLIEHPSIFNLYHLYWTKIISLYIL